MLSSSLRSPTVTSTRSTMRSRPGWDSHLSPASTPARPTTLSRSWSGVAVNGNHRRLGNQSRNLSRTC